MHVQTPVPAQLLTRGEAAKRLSLGLRTVAKLIADGELRVVRIGAAVRIAERDLDEFVSRHRRCEAENAERSAGQPSVRDIEGGIRGAAVSG